jgi:hypothetical protein
MNYLGSTCPCSGYRTWSFSLFSPSKNLRAESRKMKSRLHSLVLLLQCYCFAFVYVITAAPGFSLISTMRPFSIKSLPEKVTEPWTSRFVISYCEFGSRPLSQKTFASASHLLRRKAWAIPSRCSGRLNCQAAHSTAALLSLPASDAIGSRAARRQRVVIAVVVWSNPFKLFYHHTEPVKGEVIPYKISTCLACVTAQVGLIERVPAKQHLRASFERVDV